MINPPRASVLYNARVGTRLQKEKETAGENALEFPDDPKTIGPWVIGECVGKGASGHVKIARHHRTGQLAAIKILPLQPVFNSRNSLNTQKAKTDKQRLGIDREITMMKLMNHPNIMRIYDVYEGETELYLVLEYVEGGELFDFLVNRGKLAPLEALAYFKQIVYGLNYAHSFSIIHRDLKPENILIHSIRPPLVKIADWGMAAFAPPSLHLETSCGSPHYASPEIVNGHKYQGTATDIWSCGVILYALLTGRLPFDDKNVRTLLGKVKLGKYEIPAFVDPQAKDLIARMLVLDVNDRITMTEILAHPWMRNETPRIRYVPAPSVEELARPLPSTAHIDRDLFESLCVIWGRHVDFDSIREDLLSPPGQGTLAKAFYFLLQKHREKTLEAHGILLDDYGCEPNKVALRHYIAPHPRESLKLDLDGSSKLTQQSAHGSHHRSSTLTVPEVENPLSSRFRAPSPAGPRAQKSRPISSPVPPVAPNKHSRFSHAISRMNQQPTQGLSGQQDHFVHPRRQTQFQYPSPYPPTYQGSNAPRHNPAYPPFHAIARAATQPTPGPSTLTISSGSAIVQHPGHPVTRTSGQPRTPIRPPPMARATTAPSKHDAYSSTYQPPVLHAPIPTPYAQTILPMIAAPRVESSDVQRTIDDIADRMNLLVAHENAHYAQGHALSPSISVTPRAGDRYRHMDAWRASGATEKENHGQSQVSTQGLGFGSSVPMGKEMSTVVFTRSPAVIDQSKDKSGRKGRPPALDLQQTPTKRRNISSPLMSPQLPSPGGEFRGWFSNLFNWRAQSYVLYSLEDLSYTRDEMTRLLLQCGVMITAVEPPVSCVFRCKIEDIHDEVTAVILQKQVRFRVEFSVLGVGNGDIFSSRTMSPKLAQHPTTPTYNTGMFASAVVLVLEKGAVSTFKGAYFRLRESWRLDGVPSSRGDVTPRAEAEVAIT